MESPPPTAESAPRRRLALIAIGGVAALVAGLAAAWVLVGGGGASRPPPASVAGLVIDSSGANPGAVDSAKPLRCFVNGQFVGELSLTACAQRNGVATDALDVGLDETGALAAAQQEGKPLAPLPPTDEPAFVPDEPAAQPEEPEPSVTEAASAGTCWRHGGGRWRRLASDVDLNACVQSLFAGRCENPGGASYGRWGQETLRLIAGRVEVSDDNKTFRTLAPQGPDCSVPAVG